MKLRFWSHSPSLKETYLYQIAVLSLWKAGWAPKKPKLATQGHLWAAEHQPSSQKLQLKPWWGKSPRKQRIWQDQEKVLCYFLSIEAKLASAIAGGASFKLQVSHRNKIWESYFSRVWLFCRQIHPPDFILTQIRADEMQAVAKGGITVLNHFGYLWSCQCCDSLLTVQTWWYLPVLSLQEDVFNVN